MAVSSGMPQPFQPGFNLEDGSLLNKALSADLATWASGLTATGTTQATALQLAAVLNQCSTVASSTGVNLPPATLGSYVLVLNGGANAMKVYSAQTALFPGNTDTIDGTAGSTGVTLTNTNRGAFFYCVAPGAYISMLIGAVSS